MIPKDFRFSRWLFDRCFRRSKKWRSGNFVFLVSPARGNPRFSVVVGKKISKSAVVRNRIRRQIYEQIRLHLMPELQTHNVICLYNGGENLHNAPDLPSIFDDLLTWIEKNA